MYFNNVLGNNSIKNLLKREIATNRVPHAQLFTGINGADQLPMALAFATYLLCNNRTNIDSCGRCSNCIKMLKLTHPDLHFFYPTIKPTEGNYKKKAISQSKKCFTQFQETLLKNPYLNNQEWETLLGGNNKTVGIRKSDIIIMCKLANLRAYEGVYKIFIIWGAEKMNPEASNALLKNLEEPRPKTIFILISHVGVNLLPTIRSRLQIKSFKKINTTILFGVFKKQYPEIDSELIKNTIIENGNRPSCISSQLGNRPGEKEVHNKFITWIRLCFLSKKPKALLPDNKTHENKRVVGLLVEWCDEISNLDRQAQVQFVKTSAEICRHAFLLNYNLGFSLYPKIYHPGFNLKSFSKYMKANNISEIFSLLNNAHYYLNRYANSKILFLDLSFSLGNLLHKKN